MAIERTTNCDESCSSQFGIRRKMPQYPFVRDLDATMYEKTSRAGYARRIDVSLRARYPHLRTRLFELQKDKFRIIFDSSQQDAQSISEEFNDSIRFLTVHVTLANTLPELYLRELPILSDEDAIAEMCGLPLPKLDLVNILTARFPKSGIDDVQETPDNYSATIFVKRALPEAEQSRILTFVETFLPIRLTPMTATCRVPPLSRVKLGIGWSRGVARDAEQ